LHIPALNVSQPIVELPLENGRWDVSSLGGKVGRLGSTGAYPGDTLAPVFAGHMTFPTSATLETGAFANLQYATYGTELIYELNGEETVYTVTEISRVAPEEVERLYLADGDSILLVTCTDWDGDGRVYTNRLLVRAVRSK
jgi:LPXTG-site transpeptidase (sortase) family protein